MPSQFVIVSRKKVSAGAASLGSRKQVVSDLARFNTAAESPVDGDVLYGPGIRLELPPQQDPLTQMLLTVIEEEIAWQVMMRLAKTFDWKIVDPDSGRELNA